VTDLADQLGAALADRYRLERELGGGGMATVFLAEDLKHHRRVAIKVLRPELTALLGPERFLREIEIGARLQHPHILTLLDSGDAQGLLYYVMPFVAGESLRERIDRERQLPIEEALRLTREVADALDHAHRARVVHRDIKPENILLQAGHAVVADFGIARAVSAAGGTRLTTTGTTVGTPAYMSPEQVMGGRDLDGRSDLYSLGCVLYEMLAGVPPFAGAAAESLAYQHLSVSPPPVTSVRPSVPKDTVDAIAKCLAKTPADRFVTAAEFASALRAPDATATVRSARPVRRWLLVAGAAVLIALTFVAWRFGPSLFHGGASVPGKKEWILVAEFDGPADDSSVAKAVRDLVSAALDQSAIVTTVPDDQIQLALEQAGKPRGTRVSADLALELAYRRSIRAVVEGRVSRLGKGYSLVVRAVDADSARVLVALSEAARTDDELIPMVGRVAKRLRSALGERRDDLRATRDLYQVMTSSLEAYKRYVKARELNDDFDYLGSIAMARSALSLDPHFAAAWLPIGYSFEGLGERDSALAAFEEAQRRPDQLREGSRIACSSAIAELQGDSQGALEVLDQGARLLPELAWIHNNRGALLGSLGRREEALASLRRAEQVSPVGPSQMVLLNEFIYLLTPGSLDEARGVARRLKGGLAAVAPAQLAVAAGDWAAAESLGRALQSDPHAAANDRIGISPLAVALAARGSVRAAEQALQQDQQAAGKERRGVELEHAKRGRLVLDLVSGRMKGIPGDVASSDTTTLSLVTQGLWEAAAGDTARARKLLARIRRRSVIEQKLQGSNPMLIEAWIAARAGSWEEVVGLGPAARQGDDLGSVLSPSNRVLKRWLVAEAYERLGRPDSAAAYFELAMSPIGDVGALRDARIAYSYAHQRLVLLYARMLRPEEARRHWEIFSATFTRPDPEMAPLVEETRAALASAERTAKSAPR
jgi:tetratricopeptide (TPR) repeat protein